MAHVESMGIAESKSPLERRNTVARRSQRRSITNVKARVDKVFPSIKRFKSVNKDETYHTIHTEIEHLQNELMRKARDLQPQVRNLYDNTLKKLDAAFIALDDKLKENQEKSARKQKEQEEKAEKKKKNKNQDVASENNDGDVEIQEVEEEQEATNLEESTDKRKTVELKFVQIIPDEVIQADVHNNNVAKSPEEKRKSILKHGVAVMPGAMMNEMASKPRTVSIQQHQDNKVEDNEKINTKINEIIENLQATEYQIADFIGKRNGTQHNRIRDKLLGYMDVLDGFSPSDDYTVEQINICKNYVTSCLNFLEEKALDEEKLQDDVFYPAAVAASPVVSPVKLLVDVTERVSDKTVAEEITNDVKKHLKILEQRATKDQSFRRPSNQRKTGNEDEEKLMKLKNDLLNIKTTIDTTPTNAENLFLGLKGRLDLVKLGLDQLKFTSEDEEKQRDILYNEVETLKNMVEAKISLTRQAVRQWPIEQDKEKVNLEELRKIEEKFQTLKPQIESFTGVTSDNKFYELDENSIKLILKMDKLDFERGSESHTKKIELLKEIYNYGDLLDQRAKQSEDLLEVERGVNDIERNFARNLKLKDLDALNEKDNQRQYNEHLLQRKQTCIRNMEALFEKISSNKERSTTDNVPKQVAAINPSYSISTIELQFARVKKEIDAFPGTSTENNIKLAQGNELRSRTIVLSKEVHAYIDILRSKAEETETIKEVENQLKSINDMIDTYKGMDTELNAIEHELRTVQKKLESIRVCQRRKPLDEKGESTHKYV
ncbi:hypothetical protein NQ315_001711 [Exocentrus adspersus]|uniref:Uncharacterized protein n=1 Tax=Exocentrus adspersus TaxID=1586481 RepID=A0AAV8WA06_9CUCU|nr:hypothetical protein NQ315_001711 [Exocentrus adspersus]